MKYPCVAILVGGLLLCGSVVVGDASAHWGQWRGPLSTGEAPHADPPIEWSETKNVAWKTSLPGKGLSSPIVWGNRVFVTTAIPSGAPVSVSETAHADHDDGAHNNIAAQRKMKFVVLAFDTADGTLAWERTLRVALPHDATHETGSWASPSAVTDGKRLFVSFGSAGIYALDLAGKLLWERDLGQMQVRHSHGEGSSPALYKDTLVVNWDHQGDSFLIALNTRNGETKWKIARDEMTSWSSPLIVEVEGKPQVVVSATDRVRGYDLSDGTELWACAGFSRNVVATPVAGDGLLFASNSYDWQALLAIRLAGAKGEITGTEQVVWARDRDTSYVPSPLLYDGRLYFLKHSHGFLSAVDAATGRSLYGPVRLGRVRNVFASPIAAAGRIYVADRDGAVLVARAGDAYESLAVNHLDDSFAASPAAVGDALYLRGDRYLYKLRADSTPEPAAPGAATPQP